MKESELERRLVRGVQALGGCAYKFVSPGSVGVPDRLVILPGGRIVFVELKTERGSTSKMQDYQIGKLRGLGAEVRVLRGAVEIAGFLDWCFEVVRGLI